MKSIRLLIVLGLMVIAFGCSTISVQYDYDTKTDFTSLKTFNLIPVKAQADIDAFNVKRIQGAVRTQLESKGCTMTNDNPGFLISMHLGKKEKIQVTNWGYSYGPRWGGYGGPGRMDVFEYEEETLILDFVDAQSKELIWRGVAKGDVERYANREKRDERINEDVQKLLKNLPPTK